MLKRIDTLKGIVQRPVNYLIVTTWFCWQKIDLKSDGAGINGYNDNNS